MTTFEMITEICKNTQYCTSCIFDKNGCLFSRPVEKWNFVEIEKRLKIIRARIERTYISGDELMKKIKEIYGTNDFGEIIEKIK